MVKTVLCRAVSPKTAVSVAGTGHVSLTGMAIRSAPVKMSGGEVLKLVLGLAASEGVRGVQKALRRAPTIGIGERFSACVSAAITAGTVGHATATIAASDPQTAPLESAARVFGENATMVCTSWPLVAAALVKIAGYAGAMMDTILISAAPIHCRGATRPGDLGMRALERLVERSNSPALDNQLPAALVQPGQ